MVVTLDELDGAQKLQGDQESIPVGVSLMLCPEKIH